MSIIECDRRPLQIPKQTLSMVQDSAVGIFQNAVFEKL